MTAISMKLRNDTSGLRRGLPRPIAAAALLAVLAALGACGGPQTRYADHLARGQRYLEQGKIEKANLEFRNAIQVAPKAERAWYFAGRAAEMSGDFRTAFARYHEAVELDHGDLDAVASLGKLFVVAGAPERALDTVAPALLLHPDSPLLLAVRGSARARQNDDEGARADAERAVALAPDNEEAAVLLAALLRKAGESAKAIELVSAAEARRPATISLHEVLANLHLADGDRKAAESEMRRLVELQPQRPEPRYRLALLLTRFGQLDEAQKVLEQTVVQLPSNQGAKLALADFLSTHRSRAEGERALRDFISKDPADLDLRLGLGALLERSSATIEAMAVYREIVARDARSPRALIARERMAASEASQGHTEEAWKLVREIIALNPQDAEALTLRGNLELDRGDPTAAVADLRAVLRGQPNAVEVRRMLARAHLALHEPQLAEEELRTAVAAAPGNVPVRVDLAQLLGQTGRIQAAIALLEEAVQKFPQSGPSREALVRAYLGSNDFVRARAAAEDLKTLLPESAIGHYLAGVAAVGERKPDDAQRNFQQALQRAPGSLEILSELAKLDFGQGHPDPAIDRVRAASAAQPRSAPLRNLLGELLASDKQPAAALDAFREAAALAPKWWLPWRNLALVHHDLHDDAAAIADDEAGLKESPDDPALVSQLALLYENAHRVDDAIRAYESLLKAHPTGEVVANNLAMLLLNYRTDPQSLERAAALTASFAKSGNPSFLDTYGWALYKNGKFGEARNSFEQAAAKARDSDVIRYHLGMAELKDGEPDKARADLAAALAHSDRFDGAAEARTVLASLQANATTSQR